MRVWCGFGAVLVRVWCGWCGSFFAYFTRFLKKLVRVWCGFGAVLVRVWCGFGAGWCGLVRVMFGAVGAGLFFSAQLVFCVFFCIFNCFFSNFQKIQTFVLPKLTICVNVHEKCSFSACKASQLAKLFSLQGFSAWVTWNNASKKRKPFCLFQQSPCEFKTT